MLLKAYLRMAFFSYNSFTFILSFLPLLLFAQVAQLLSYVIRFGMVYQHAVSVVLQI